MVIRVRIIMLVVQSLGLRVGCGWMLSAKIYVEIHDKTNTLIRSAYSHTQEFNMVRKIK